MIIKSSIPRWIFNSAACANPPAGKSNDNGSCIPPGRMGKAPTQKSRDCLTDNFGVQGNVMASTKTLCFMWIRKLPVEVSSENRSRLLRSTGLDVLLGLGLWYGLVRLSEFFGLSYRASVSGFVACGLVAVILPASWLASRRARHRRESTMVCDRCNALKVADDQLACNCGGQYLVLSEMKWINARPDGQTLPTKPESHLLSPPIRWRTIQKRPLKVRLQDVPEVVS